MDATVIVIRRSLRLCVGASDRLAVAAAATARGAKQTVETLRLQLDEVVKERDVNRERGDQARRARSRAGWSASARFEQRIERRWSRPRRALSAQFREIGDKLLGEGAQEISSSRPASASPKPTRPASQARRRCCSRSSDPQALRGRPADGREGARRPLCRPARGGRAGADRAGAGPRRDRATSSMRCAPRPRRAAAGASRACKNVLEQAGPARACRFPDRGVGRRRGRAAAARRRSFALPGGRKLVIDAKCSLNAYLDACDEVDDDKREACFRAHVASIRNHAQQLGSKAYWAQFGDAADYVVMYIPGEHFLTAALEQDPTPVGLGVRAAGAARDADQPRRDRHDRREQSGGRRGWPRPRRKSRALARSCTRGLRRWLSI